MNKSLLIQAICEKVENELNVIRGAARAAHEAATDPENKAENQYDTRGLEASYLAEAQAKRVAELEEILIVYRATQPRDFELADSVAPTALVEVQSGSKRSSVFILARGGGLTITFEGKSVQTVTPQSPLGEALIGLKCDDTVEVENGRSVREYKIISLC